MSGYIRQDTSNNIATGSVINATDLDNEFDAVVSAFNSSSGHKHDGTSGEGAPITATGPSQDVVTSAIAMSPKTNNTIDLGTTSLKYKNLYTAGVANIASLVADTADINAGTIDATVIGGTTAAAGTFSALVASSATVGGVTVANTTGSQTLTNKTISADSNTLSGIAASSFVLSDASGNIDGAAVQKAIPSGVVVGTTDTQTLTNKTINLTSNTLVTTSAQLLAALTDETGTGSVVFSASPTLTGTPIAPTATVGTNTTQIATTAFVTAAVTAATTGTVTVTTLNTTNLALGGTTLTVSGAELNFVAGVTSAIQTQIGSLQSQITDRATIASPTFTGVPLAPTAAVSTNTTQIATTAFVQAALSGSGLGDMLKAVYDSNSDGAVNLADAWTTARTITIGSTGKSVNGSADVTWTAAEIGINDATLTLATSGIATGSQTFTSNQSTAATFTVNVPATDLTATAGTTAGPTINSSTGTDVVIPSASANASGIVTTDAQTLAGVKTFSTSISTPAATITTLTLGATAITATGTELNYVDGVTSAIQTQFSNKQPLDAALTSISGLTTAANQMIYTTASDTYAATSLTLAGRQLLDDADAAAQLVTLGLTATAAELNALDGITASVAELNFVDGVTSAIQTQLNAKQPLDDDLTALAAIGTTGILVRTGAGTAVTRAIAAGTGISIADGTGVGANPTITALASNNYQEFTASGTWTKPIGLHANAIVTIKVWGGGGGGGRGGSNYTIGNGGGGGGYADVSILASQLGATETVTVAAGAIAKSTAGDGNSGGSSSFGSILTVYGGTGGGGNTNDNSVGAAGSYMATGYPGDGSFRATYGSAAGNVTTYPAFNGGGGGKGFSGATGYGNNLSLFGGNGGATAGASGSAPAGGGAGLNTNSGSAGAGGRGEVRVWIIGGMV